MLAESIKNSLDSKDIVYFGVPIKCKNIYLFGTAGFGGDEKYFEKIIHNVSPLSLLS